MASGIEENIEMDKRGLFNVPLSGPGPTGMAADFDAGENDGRGLGWLACD